MKETILSVESADTHCWKSEGRRAAAHRQRVVGRRLGGRRPRGARPDPASTDAFSVEKEVLQQDCSPTSRSQTKTNV